MGLQPPFSQANADEQPEQPEQPLGVDYGGTNDPGLNDYVNHFGNMLGGPLHPGGFFLSGPFKGKTPGQAREMLVSEYKAGKPRSKTPGVMNSGNTGRNWITPDAAWKAKFAGKGAAPAAAAAQPAQPAAPATPAPAMAPPSRMAALTSPAAMKPAPMIAAPAMMPGQMPTGAAMAVRPDGRRSITGPYGTGSSLDASQQTASSFARSGVFDETGRQVSGPAVDKRKAEEARNAMAASAIIAGDKRNAEIRKAMKPTAQRLHPGSVLS